MIRSTAGEERVGILLAFALNTPSSGLSRQIFITHITSIGPVADIGPPVDSRILHWFQRLLRMGLSMAPPNFPECVAVRAHVVVFALHAMDSWATGQVGAATVAFYYVGSLGIEY